jgi:parallel beta-helix repeat protein
MDYLKIRTWSISVYLVFILVLLGILGMILIETENYNTSVDAAVITVDISGSGDYTSIQAAINNANTGDTVQVYPGYYYEVITISTQINLVGSGIGTTFITSDYSNWVICIFADGVTVNGFEITMNSTSSSYSGIVLSNVRDCNISFNKCLDLGNGISLESNAIYNKISNNICEDNYASGIRLSYAQYNTIQNNNCSDNWGSGLYLYNSGYNNILNNSCTYNEGNGIYLYQATNNKIQNNSCIGNWNCGVEMYYSSNYNQLLDNRLNNNDNNGLELYSSQNNFIINNSCSNNYEYGFYLDYSQDNIIKNNSIISDLYAIFITESPNNILDNNTMIGSGLFIYGLSFSEYIHTINTTNLVNGKPLYYYKNDQDIVTPQNASEVIIVNCQNITVQNLSFNQCGVGVLIAYSNTMIIRNNTFNNINYGCKLKYSSDVEIYNNTFSDIINGIDTDYSSRNLFSNNTFSNIQTGFDLLTSDQNKLFNNSITGSIYGMILDDSSYNEITNNTIIDCYSGGIYLSYAPINSFYKNAFTNCGLVIFGNVLVEYIQNIDDSNTVNGKLLYYRLNQSSGSINDVGQVFLVNSENINVKNSNLNNCSIGIELIYSSNILLENIVSSNNTEGIFSYYSHNNTFDNHLVSDNSYNGMRLYCSPDNNVINTRLLNNNYYGLNLYRSSKTMMRNINCSSNDYGINFYWSGFNTIDDSIVCWNYDVGINLYFSDFNKFNRVVIKENQWDGLNFDDSNYNVLNNCTIHSNFYDDIYIRDDSARNVAINTTIYNLNMDYYYNNELIVKNYLDIQVNSSKGVPVKDVEVLVKDNNNIVYSTPGYGGANSKTDEAGQIKWILVTDRIYYNSEIAFENITTVSVKSKSKSAKDNNRPINMSKSHLEYFVLNTPPNMVVLQSPVNGSIINTTNIEFNWEASSDSDGDKLSYRVVVDKNNGDWFYPYINQTTNDQNVSWNPPLRSMDGRYKWRVCANDGSDNGPWCEPRMFTLDTTAPIPPLNATVEPSDWTSKNEFMINYSEPYDLTGVKPGVYYFMGEDDPIENTNWTEVADNSLILTTPSEGESQIYLWLEDNAGNSDYQNHDDLIIKLDSTPPVIEFTPTSTIMEGEDLQISTSVYDNLSGLDEVVFYYKKPNDGTYTAIQMKGSIRGFSAAVSSEEIGSEGIEYYIEAADRAKPKNVIYYGQDGITSIEPTEATDIDLKVMFLPTVLNVTPSHESFDIAVSSKITITFSKAMDKNVTENAFYISPSTSGNFSWVENTMIFIPSFDLKYDVMYTVKILSSAADLEGITFSTVYSWSFTTERKVEGSGQGGDGDGKRTFLEEPLFYLILIIIIVIIILLVLLIFVKKRKAKAREEELRVRVEDMEGEVLRTELDMEGGEPAVDGDDISEEESDEVVEGEFIIEGDTESESEVEFEDDEGVEQESKYNVDWEQPEEDEYIEEPSEEDRAYPQDYDSQQEYYPPEPERRVEYQRQYQEPYPAPYEEPYYEPQAQATRDEYYDYPQQGERFRDQPETVGEGPYTRPPPLYPPIQQRYQYPPEPQPPSMNQDQRLYYNKPRRRSI